MFEKLDDTNFILYAAKNYENPDCVDVMEFYDDLARFKYIKRLFNRYEEHGDLKERLILNHLIVLYNMFDNAATRMLFLKMDGYHSYLKPFLILLGRMPDVVVGIGSDGKDIRSSDIELEEDIVKALRNI